MDKQLSRDDFLSLLIHSIENFNNDQKAKTTMVDMLLKKIEPNAVEFMDLILPKISTLNCEYLCEIFKKRNIKFMELNENVQITLIDRLSASYGKSAKKLWEVLSIKYCDLTPFIKKKICQHCISFNDIDLLQICLETEEKENEIHILETVEVSEGDISHIKDNISETNENSDSEIRWNDIDD